MGIHLEQGPDDIAKICIDSKADIVVVESEAFLKKVLLVQHKLPELKAIVQWKGEPSISDKRRLHRTHKVGTKLIVLFYKRASRAINLSSTRAR